MVLAVLGACVRAFMGRCWWHHVEQIDDTPLPISYTIFSNLKKWKHALTDEHDLMRRRLYPLPTLTVLLHLLEIEYTTARAHRNLVMKDLNTLGFTYVLFSIARNVAW